MPQFKSSPWAGQLSDEQLAKRRKTRFWMSQPVWFCVPMVVLGAASVVGAEAIHELRPDWLGGVGFLLLAVIAPLMAALTTQTGRLVLQERGILIRKLGETRFIPYRQLDSIRDRWEKPDSKGRQGRHTEISLKTGEPLKLGGSEEMRRSIVAAWTVWIRDVEDAEQTADQSAPEGSAYRGRQAD